MKRLMIPGRFQYGSDILEEFASLASCYGSRFVFIGGRRATAAVKERLVRSFEGSGCSYDFVECGAVTSLSEIERVMALDCVKDAEVVCGVGGGTALDVARTAGNRLGKALVMIPTTVASDAACSPVSVFYTEDGSAVVGDQFFHKCPDLVLVDSGIIAEAPARHIAAGMGDGLATWYEGMTNYRSPKRHDITETGLMFGSLARDLILEYGPDAYRSVREHIVTPALEKIIEANCFLSGVGGMNTGCAAAHGIGDYLGGVRNCHRFLHGERVFVGLMVQLILEGCPKEEILRLMRFGRQVGLPLCLEDLEIETPRETARAMAKDLQTDHFMVNLSCDYSVELLTGAFLLAGQYRRELGD